MGTLYYKRWSTGHYGGEEWRWVPLCRVFDNESLGLLERTIGDRLELKFVKDPRAELCDAIKELGA